MKSLLLTILGIIACYTMQAQSFTKYKMPTGLPKGRHRLVVDYHGNRQILFPVIRSGKLYVKGATDSFKAISYGLYINAFYANNGDLYLVENTDTLSKGYKPKLFKSTDNGNSFSEIIGVSGRIFHRDHAGNLFYSVSGGFKYSTNSGGSFTMVNTPDSAFTAAINSSGSLFYINKSNKLFRSMNNGGNWQDISKTIINPTFLEFHLEVVADTLYLQSGSNILYTTENGSTWNGVIVNQLTSIVTALCITPDLSYYCLSPYGFFHTNTPQLKWTHLNASIGQAQNTIYNNYITATDSFVWFLNDTGYLYSPRTGKNLSAITKIRIAETVSIYPNPSSNEIFCISTGAGKTIILYNMEGKELICTKLDSPTQPIDISTLPAGLYTWRVGGRNGKLVVQK